MDSYSQKKYDSHPSNMLLARINNFDKKIVCDVNRPSYYHNTVIEPKLNYPTTLTDLDPT